MKALHWKIPQQLFLFSKETVKSISRDELSKLFSSLAERHLADPPYPEFAIKVPMHCICPTIRSYDERIMPTPEHYESIFHFESVSMDGEPGIRIEEEIPGTGKIVKQLCQEDVAKGIMTKEQAEIDAKMTMEQGTFLYALLIVLLATRETERITTHNKLARQGIGKQKAVYSTTLKINGPIKIYLPAKKSDPTGLTRCPHDRRGHPRRQRYGPGLQFIREIFVQPTKIHPDSPRTKIRSGYNVSPT